MRATDSTAALFRIEFPKLVGGLARWVGGDVGLAEELAQDAIVDALRQWPREGTPRNPGAWLMTVAKRKAVDRFRRDRVLESKYLQIAAADPGGPVNVEIDDDRIDDDHIDDDHIDDDHIDDDRLRLIFVACHPVIPVSSRVALTLRLVGGLTTVEIARAYLQSEGTIAQRIVRAKKVIAKEGVPFEVPAKRDRARRIGSVLEVIYLIYNEGYSATAGEDWLRPELCVEALRLGRLLAALVPSEPEAHGLVALMEIQSSRIAARTGADGKPILLLVQDRRKWDRLLINRGLASLAQAERLSESRGPYTLQAAIAACHAGRAFRPEETDWALIAQLYGRLARTAPSPIVELNRAVALSRAMGPEVALDLVDQLVETGTLERYHLLHGVRGDLLDQLGRHAEAAAEFERGASLTLNAGERQLLRERAAKASSGGAGDRREAASQVADP